MNEKIKIIGLVSKPQKKIALLQELQMLVAKFDNPIDLESMVLFEQSEKENMYAQARAIHELKSRLHSNIYAQLKEINEPKASSNMPMSASELLNGMSPEAADRFMGILVKGENETLLTELSNIYATEDNANEAVAFKAFLTNNNIRFLGGENSKNFLVTSNDGLGSTKVIKVDCRMNQKAREIETHLRQALGNKVAPVDSERGAMAFLDGTEQLVSRSLIVTDFYEKGTIQTQRERMVSVSDQSNLHDSAATMMRKMADMYLELQAADCFFPDSKWSNWMVKDNNQLCLFDTKSILVTDGNGVYHNPNRADGDTGIMSTIGYAPDDFINIKQKKEPINVDATHAYLLGKNLCAYLTNEAPPMDYLVNPTISNAYFDKDVFNGERGQAFKEIIQSLVHKIPSKRMAIDDAQQLLSSLENVKDLSAYQETKQSLAQAHFKTASNELLELSFGENDEGMMTYLKECQEKFDNPATNQAQLIQDMKKMACDLNGGENAAVKKAVNKFRKKSIWNTKDMMGRKAKATSIEQAMSKVAVADRINLIEEATLSDSNPAANNVLKSMAKLRHQLPGHKNDKLATSFKQFKEQFKEKFNQAKSAQSNIVKDAGSDITADMSDDDSLSNASDGPKC